MSKIRKACRDYFDLAYSAYNLLKEYYTYQEIQSMPMRNLFGEIEKFKPKFQEIARQQEMARLNAELDGKKRLKMNQQKRVRK